MAQETGWYGLRWLGNTGLMISEVVNGGYMEREIELAKESGMGIIAMKAAMAVETQHKAL